MPIFERSRGGVAVTPAGYTFIRGAKPMGATADKLVAMMRAASQGRAGGLVLGHNGSVSAGTSRLHDRVRL
jgi:DNA-binding transcriptional LysR family regulator